MALDFELDRAADFCESLELCAVCQTIGSKDVVVKKTDVCTHACLVGPVVKVALNEVLNKLLVVVLLAFRTTKQVISPAGIGCFP